MIEVDENWLFSIHKFLEIPDTIFYLRVSVDEALSRIERRDGNRDVFENRKSLELVKLNYDKIMAQRNVFRVIEIETSERSENEIVETVLTILKSQFDL